jgi:hypothetical protein
MTEPSGIEAAANRWTIQPFEPEEVAIAIIEERADVPPGMTPTNGIQAWVPLWPSETATDDKEADPTRAMEVAKRICNAMNARPAASGDLRERIARIIDPMFCDALALSLNPNRTEQALAKAAAILAMLPGLDEEAIRKDERERCAQVADKAMAEFSDLTERQSVSGSPQLAECATICGIAARDIGDAIRARKTGGAKP